MNQMSFETFTWTWLICAGFLACAGIVFLIFRFMVLRSFSKLEKTRNAPFKLHPIPNQERRAA